MKSSNNGLSRFFDADGDIISEEALARKLKQDSLFILLHAISMANRKELLADKADKIKLFFADEDKKIDRLLSIG